MPVELETAAVAVVSALGAVGVAAVTFRHYEPPSRDGEDEAPEPVFEAGVHFVLSAVLFSLLGFALVFVGGQFGAVGRAATLVLTPLGLYVARTIRAGELSAEAGRATELIGFVSALVLAVYPPVVFAASAV